jgi:hypothetical protein
MRRYRLLQSIQALRALYNTQHAFGEYPESMAPALESWREGLFLLHPCVGPLA